jgi:hypothetical protein
MGVNFEQPIPPEPFAILSKWISEAASDAAVSAAGKSPGTRVFR